MAALGPERVFCSDRLCDKIHKVGVFGVFFMAQTVLPIFVFAACATAVAVTLLGVSALIGPHRTGPVKEMP